MDILRLHTMNNKDLNADSKQHNGFNHELPELAWNMQQVLIETGAQAITGVPVND